MKGFYQLTPDRILSAIEKLGFPLTGRTLQLNSYENRVFELECESFEGPADSPSRLVAKFYRPQRWTKQQIQDEHDFLFELEAEGVPVVTPLQPLAQGTSLFTEHFDEEPIHFCVFPKRSGRLPQELGVPDLRAVGRRLAQIHNIGARHVADHRPTLNAQNTGWENLELLGPAIWPELRNRYQDLASQIIEAMARQDENLARIRIHGDCHRGNLLQTGQRLADMSPEYFFVDFDDFLNGPAAQDFWMLIDGDEQTAHEQMHAILDGYETLRDWDDAEWELLPILRGLRLVSYSAWILKRWNDPSFPQLFPQFNSYLYWLEEADQLEKILRQID